MANLGFDSVVALVWRARTTELMAMSLALTAAVCATCLVLGVASAWVLSSVQLPGQRCWIVASAVPLAMPSYVAAYGWVAMISGWSGFFPAWLLLSAVSVPYVTLPVLAAMRLADPSLSEMARSQGRNRRQAWRLATFPQIAPAAAAGGLLVALYVMSDYGAVSMFRLPVFTYAISRQYQSFIGHDAAAVLALLLVGFAVSFVLLERLVRGRGERWRVGSGARRPAELRRAGPALAGYLLLLSLAPLIAVAVPMWTLFAQLIAGTARSLVWADLATAVFTTTWLAAAAALLAVLLAMPIGLLSARYRGRAVESIVVTSFTGHALPGIVLGLSLVFFSLRVVPSLYQTAALLVFGYAVLYLPKAVGSTRTTIATVPPSLAEMAQSLGRRRSTANWLTTWRLASPGIAAGGLLVMVTVMKELPATLLLRPTGMDTLATSMWSRTFAMAYGAAAPYAIALVFVAAIPAYLLTRPDTWERGR